MENSAIKHSTFYQQGYYDGYKEGFDKAYKLFKSQLLKQPIQYLVPNECVNICDKLKEDIYSALGIPNELLK